VRVFAPSENASDPALWAGLAKAIPKKKMGFQCPVMILKGIPTWNYARCAPILVILAMDSKPTPELAICGKLLLVP
jgi:hypothetical protein